MNLIRANVNKYSVTTHCNVKSPEWLKGDSHRKILLETEDDPCPENLPSIVYLSFYPVIWSCVTVRLLYGQCVYWICLALLKCSISLISEFHFQMNDKFVCFFQLFLKSCGNKNKIVNQFYFQIIFDRELIVNFLFKLKNNVQFRWVWATKR